jgi:hypothetical protein
MGKGITFYNSDDDEKKIAVRVTMADVVVKKYDT